MGLCGHGQDWSGKTFAFAIPILHTLSVDLYGIYAVFLTLTREFANQIGDSFMSLCRGMNLRIIVVTGGRDTIKQSLDHLVGWQIISGQTQHFHSAKWNILVLDEGEEIDFLKVKQTDNYFVQYNTQFMQWVWFTIIIRYQRQICKRKWLEKLSWVHLTSFDIGVTITVEKLVHAIEAHTSVSWSELEQEDEKIGEIMVQVNSWTREAEFKLEQNDWGKNHDVIVRKKKIKQGIDPDVDSKMKKKSKLKLMKSRRRNF